MQKQLNGKVALITGGSRGLGVAIALELASQGADVAISYVNSADKADQVVAKLHALGVRAAAFQSDQADLEAGSVLVRNVIQHFGRLDILVNNAAIAVQGQTVDDLTLDAKAYNQQWQVNALGAIATTRAAAPVLADGGRIVFIGSAFGSRVSIFKGVADYAGTKAAVVGYARGIARELGERNITVNVVQPGIMPTDMAGDIANSVPAAILDLHCIRRIATLEEVAGSVAFLAGPSAGYITGNVLDLSGGYMA